MKLKKFFYIFHLKISHPITPIVPTHSIIDFTPIHPVKATPSLLSKNKTIRSKKYRSKV